MDEGWSELLNGIKDGAAVAVKPEVDKSLITIDETSGVPLWMQLRNRLTYLITSGAFPAGAQLPSVREMALDLNLNYNTVNKVFRDIERDGYVITRRGRGTFVAEVNTMAGQNAAAAADLLVDRFLEECRELGLSETEAAALVAKRAGGLYI
ncbi:MAG: GntR family transcriptional regulator [Eggerthellaceae bacterium]|nr:GntR family transcriptional regulator [Eggerthellaceae bacterium]